jgi:hypothetical protein
MTRRNIALEHDSTSHIDIAEIWRLCSFVLNLEETSLSRT